jgi:hypothetical protein
MRQYETKIKTITYENIVKITCDICGNEISNDRRSYYRDECTIMHEYGTEYSDGSDLLQFKPDICTSCFEKHIIPFLKDLGVNIEYKDISQ